MSTRLIHIQKWADTQSPTETLLTQKLRAEGLSPQKWASDPHAVFDTHAHEYEKILYVVEGCITFGFAIEGEPITLYPGDRLDLPAGIMHIAVAGADGVVCLEAQCPLK